MKQDTTWKQSLKRVLSLIFAVALAFSANGRVLAAQSQTINPGTPAVVLTGQPVEEAEISLIFEGDFNLPLLNNLLALLEKHQAKGGFFIPAITAAEQPQLTALILEKGHWIGNYLLKGEKRVDEMSAEDRLNNIIKAQEVFINLTGSAPDYLRANVSRSTQEVLESVGEAGIKYLLVPDYYLNHTSFTNAAQADRYVAGIADGSILSFKVNQPLEASEMPEVAAKPTDSFTPEATPGPKAGASPMPTYNQEERLLQVVEWMLSALEGQGKQMVSIGEMLAHQQSDYSALIRKVYAQTEAASLAAGISPESPKAAVITSALTLSPAISLVFEGEAKPETLAQIEAILQERNVHATFFFPALYAARLSTQVISLSAHGHDVGNYLLAGEKHASKLHQAEQVDSLYKAQQILDGIGIKADYFKANVSEYTGGLLQSAAAVGLTQAVDPTLFLNHSSFNNPQQVLNYVDKTPAGSIISIKLNQVLDASEVRPAVSGTILPTPTPSASQRPVSDTSDPTKPPAPEMTIDESLVQLVDWLTAAYLQQGMRFVTLDELVLQQQQSGAVELGIVLNETPNTIIDKASEANAPLAEVIQSGAVNLPQKRVSLVFEGTISKESLNELSALLKTRGVQSVFFIPGEKLTQLQDVLSGLLNDGHALGNYFLHGEKGAAALGLDMQVDSLYRSLGIARVLTGKETELFKGNDTELTEEMLKAARAVGLTAAVLPLAYLNHTSFANAQKAADYAEHTLDGAIISFKMNDFISAQEAGLPETTPKPSDIALPTNPPEKVDALTTEQRLIQNVTWLLDALLSKGFVFETPQLLASHQQMVYPKGTINGILIKDSSTSSAAIESIFAQADGTETQVYLSTGLLGQIDGQSPRSSIITSGLVQAKEVSLMIEVAKDLPAVDAMLALLDLHQIKATFFIPANLLAAHKELAEKIVAAGHQLGNYLMLGEKRIQDLENKYVAESIYRAQQILNGFTKGNTTLFKGNQTALTDNLLQVSYANGLPYALQPTAILNAGSFVSFSQAQGYARQTDTGTLISLKLDQAIDPSELIGPTGSPPPQASPTPSAATATPVPQSTAAASDKPRDILATANWLLEALQSEGFAFVSPQKLFEDQQSDYSKLMTAIETEQASSTIAKLVAQNTKTLPVFTAQPVLEKEISLVVQGIGDESTMDKLLELLDKYQIKAIFFLPAAQAAAQKDVVQRIVQHGHRIGNHGLYGEPHLETLGLQALSESIYRAQVILTDLSGSEPELLLGRATRLDETVLTTAALAKLKAALQPSLYVNHTSLKTNSQADAFAEQTEWGTILSLKLNQGIDPVELPAKETESEVQPNQQAIATPSPTAQPLQTETMLNPSLDDEGKLLVIAEWLLDAYSRQAFKFVSPEQILHDKNLQLATLLQQQKVPSGSQTEYVRQALTTDRELSLAVKLPQNAEAKQTLLSALKKSGVQVFVAVSGDDVLLHAEFIKQLAAQGHQIVSRGFSAKSISRMNYQQAYLEISRNNLLMLNKLGFDSKFYMPLSGQVSQAVLEAAFDLGVKVLGYQTRIVPEYGHSAAATVAEALKWGVRRGDILYVDAGDNHPIAQLIIQASSIVEDTGYSLVSPDKLMDNTYTLKPLEEIAGWDAIQVNPDYEPNESLLWRKLSQIPVKDNVVFLAVDDWGSDKTITRMLDVLDQYNVKATFFVISKRAAANPNMLRAIDEAGHSIANHSYDHEIIHTIPPKELQELTVKGYQEVTVALGHTPELLYQPPQLEDDRPSSNAIMATGYYHVIGSWVSTQDYTRSADEVVRYVREKLTKGSIILIHSSDHASANDALPGIIAEVHKQGYTFGLLIDYLPLKTENGKVVAK